MNKFARPEPYAVPPADLDGFSAGILRIEWACPVESFEIGSRKGRVFIAQIVECRTSREMLERDVVNAALVGLIVRDPAEGRLSKIAGLESFTVMHLGTGTSGSIGLLLTPMEEP